MIIALFALCFAVSAFAADPFTVVFNQSSEGSNELVSVSVKVPPGHHIYADDVEARLEPGGRLPLFRGDRPVLYQDSFTGTERPAFSRDFSLVFNVGTRGGGAGILEFSYQGCDEKECFFPQTRSYTLQAGVRTQTVTPSSESVSAPAGWKDMTRSHAIAASASGYMGVNDFLAFLDRAEGREDSPEPGRGSWLDMIRSGFMLFSSNPGEFLRVYGAWWTVLVILIGGLLLNLTPCVLPMIPINLAILGVGSQNSTRARGLLMGSMYGLGIALVYGVLGLAVVLTGSQFGTLNSMPWFNIVIGFVFVVLALAMFDVFSIDFTRYQSAGAGPGVPGRGPVVTALIMGGVAALLAGACVAPVVIAVLLLSGNLYAQGAGIGLALPFILGLGMALPWPLAGAGLSFLPKPGKWMTWVKYGFGIFILLFAFYYFTLAYQGWRGEAPLRPAKEGVSEISAADLGKWAAILQESARTGKPVWVDFWATWCKNCEAMELTTFKDEEVQKRLSRYLVVKFQAEKPADPLTQAALEFFGVKGLPTYLVLKPVAAKDAVRDQ
jgi:thiol:disulfide interchange protein